LILKNTAYFQNVSIIKRNLDWSFSFYLASVVPLTTAAFEDYICNTDKPNNKQIKVGKKRNETLEISAVSIEN
jgi:hypothetical protein